VICGANFDPATLDPQPGAPGVPVASAARAA